MARFRGGIAIRMLGVAAIVLGTPVALASEERAPELTLRFVTEGGAPLGDVEAWLLPDRQPDDNELPLMERFTRDGLRLQVDAKGVAHVRPWWSGATAVLAESRDHVALHSLGPMKPPDRQETLVLWPRRDVELRIERLPSGPAWTVHYCDGRRLWPVAIEEGRWSASVPSIPDRPSTFRQHFTPWPRGFVVSHEGRVVARAPDGGVTWEMPRTGLVTVEALRPDGTPYTGRCHLHVRSLLGWSESTLFGGGSHTLPVVCDGTNLRVFAVPVDRSFGASDRSVKVTFDDRDQQTIALEFDPSSSPVESSLFLTGPAAITATLVDQHGAAISGSGLHVTRVLDPGGGVLSEFDPRRQPTRWSGVSDDAGRIRFPTIDAWEEERAECWLYVERSDGTVGAGSFVVDRLMLPGDNDVGRVTVGKALEVVVGEIVDEEGIPLRGMRVTRRGGLHARAVSPDGLRGRFGVPLWSRPSDAEGRFAIYGAEPMEPFEPVLTTPGYLITDRTSPTPWEWRLVASWSGEIAGRVVLGDIPAGQVRVNLVYPDGGGYQPPSEGGDFRFGVQSREPGRLEVSVLTRAEPLMVLDVVTPKARSEESEVELDLTSFVRVITVEVMDRAGQPVDGARITSPDAFAFGAKSGVDGVARIALASPDDAGGARPGVGRGGRRRGGG